MTCHDFNTGTFSPLAQYTVCFHISSVRTSFDAFHFLRLFIFTLLFFCFLLFCPCFPLLNCLSIFQNFLIVPSLLSFLVSFFFSCSIVVALVFVIFFPFLLPSSLLLFAPLTTLSLSTVCSMLCVV